jgi:hypothetical protein
MYAYPGTSGDLFVVRRQQLVFVIQHISTQFKTLAAALAYKTSKWRIQLHLPRAISVVKVMKQPKGNTSFEAAIAIVAVARTVRVSVRAVTIFMTYCHQSWRRFF